MILINYVMLYKRKNRNLEVSQSSKSDKKNISFSYPSNNRIFSSKVLKNVTCSLERDTETEINTCLSDIENVPSVYDQGYNTWYKCMLCPRFL